MNDEQSQSSAGGAESAARFHSPAGFGGLALAWRCVDARGEGLSRPGVVWLGGFKSDMLSTKAERIAQWARDSGRAFLRFDYSGHGESGGDFADGTIGVWTKQSLAMILDLTEGPQILVGSSMGGWIALLVAREIAARNLASRLAGMVLIAPAVDFTEELIWRQLPPAARLQIETTGRWLRPSAYAPEPYPITRALIEDGRRHLLFGETIRSYCPVHVLQGMNDPDVPWKQALKLIEHFGGDPIALTLIKDGDHRLSRDEDIAQLLTAIANIA